MDIIPIIAWVSFYMITVCIRRGGANTKWKITGSGSIKCNRRIFYLIRRRYFEGIRKKFPRDQWAVKRTAILLKVRTYYFVVEFIFDCVYIESNKSIKQKREAVWEHLTAASSRVNYSVWGASFEKHATSASWLHSRL